MTAGELEYWAGRAKVIRSLAKTPRCDFALRYIPDLSKATEIPGSQWQPFQIQYLNDTNTFVSINKSRQIGASFTISMDEVFDGLLKGNHTVIALSFNLEEAKEKIRYARLIYNALAENPAEIPAWDEFDDAGNWLGVSPRRIQKFPELVVDNALSLEWSNGFRFLSHPSKPPRGKRASVVLDEFHFYQQDRAIYTAALPMLTRGMASGWNRLRVASTPNGASGMFYEIHTDRKKYPDYARYDYGWWEIQDLCLPENRMACIAGYLSGTPIQQLVQDFGTKALKVFFNNAELDSFMQEYHLQFLDSSHSFLPYELIRSCYPLYYDATKLGDSVSADDGDDTESANLADYEAMYVCFKAVADGSLGDKGDLIDNCLSAIRQLATAIMDGKVSPRLTWGYDVGRDRDAAEISVMEVLPEGVRKQRLMITMRKVSFDLQKVVVKYLLDTLPIVRGFVDKGSVGRDIAEYVANNWGEVRGNPVWFTADKKEIWAIDLKKSMERKLITLIPDRDQERQLHSVTRRVTSAKNMVYEVVEDSYTTVSGKKVQHHADKFWSVALSSYAASTMTNVVLPPSQGVEVPEHLSSQKAAVSVSSKGFRHHRLTSREASANVADKMRRGG